MRQAVADVIEFRRAVSLAIGGQIDIPDMLIDSSDWKVVQEEFDELRDAVVAYDAEGIADGGVDLIVTVIGLLLRCGIDPARIWEYVQSANLAKAGGPKRADGKAMKPEGWQPPDIKEALRTQRPLRQIYCRELADRQHRGVLGGSGDDR